MEACRDDEEAAGKQEREAGGASSDHGDDMLQKREAEKSGGAQTGLGLGLRLGPLVTFKEEGGGSLDVSSFRWSTWSAGCSSV
jgi:hypothetical protein